MLVALVSRTDGNQPLCPVESPFWPECRRGHHRPVQVRFEPGGSTGGERVGLRGAQHLSFARSACQQQAVTFTLQEDGATLSLSGGPSALGFDLSKVPGPEAASRLQALTLGLAERVCSLEQRLAGGVGGGGGSTPQPHWRRLPTPPFLPALPSCRGESYQLQDERSAGGASAVLTRCGPSPMTRAGTVLVPL